MAKEKFERLLYLGPVSSFSVLTYKLVEGKNTEASLGNGELHVDYESDDRSLITGVTYDDLPMDHPVIKNLIVAELLVPDPGDTPAASSKSAVADSNNTKTGDDRSTIASKRQEGKSK